MLSEIFLDLAPQILHSFSRTSLGRNIKLRQRLCPADISAFQAGGRRIYLAIIPAAALITAAVIAITTSLIAIATLLRASRRLRPHMLTIIMAAITVLAALIPAQNL
jgi:hypothetical protein